MNDWEGVNWTDLAQDKKITGCCERLGSKKNLWNILVRRGTVLLPKKDCALKLSN
jgi:hypothetical protein